MSVLSRKSKKRSNEEKITPPKKGLVSSVANGLTSQITGLAQKGYDATIGSAINIGNNVNNVVTNKTCSSDFMESLDNVINTCDLNDYINIYNIVTKKLKEKKNYFNSDKDLVNKIELLTELEFKKKIN